MKFPQYIPIHRTFLRTLEEFLGAFLKLKKTKEFLRDIITCALKLIHDEKTTVKFERSCFKQ